MLLTGWASETPFTHVCDHPGLLFTPQAHVSNFIPPYLDILSIPAEFIKLGKKPLTSYTSSHAPLSLSLGIREKSSPPFSLLSPTFSFC